MEVKSYEQHIKDIAQAFRYQFTDSNSEFDLDSVVQFLVHHYYLNNPIKAKTDIYEYLDIDPETIEELGIQ